MNPTDLNRTEDRVRAALHGAARDLRAAAPGAGAVREAAHHRARRRQRATAGLTALAVVAGGAGAVTLLDREPAVELRGVADQPGGAPLELTWTDAEHVLYAPEVVEGPDGVLYALSTSPGATWEEFGEDPVPQTVYRSTDGVTWEPAGDLGADLRLRRDTFGISGDGVLYGLTTAPGADGVEQVQVARSADAGATWQREALPLDDSRPAVADGVQLYRTGTSLSSATNGGTTVVTARTSYGIEAEGLVDPSLQDAWLEPSADGLRIIGIEGQGGAAPDAPPAATPAAPEDGPTPAAVDPEVAERGFPSDEPSELGVIPWAEVGLEGMADLTSTAAAVSVDGGPWQEVEIPGPGLGHGQLRVVPTAEGFLAVQHFWGDDPAGTNAIRTARSTDGVSWTLDDAPVAEAQWLDAVQTVGDRVVITASTDDGRSLTALSSADAGRTWTSTDLNAMVPVADGQQVGISHVGAGPLGVAVSAVAYGPDEGEAPSTAVLLTTDGATWQQVPLDEVAPDNRGAAWVHVGADRIIVDYLKADRGYGTAVGVPTG